MKDIFSAEYNPKHIPDIPELNEWILDDAGSKERLRTTTVNKINNTEPAPLNQAESHEVQEMVLELVKEIDYRKDQILRLRKLVDSQAGSYSVQLNTKNNALKESLRRVLKDTSGLVSYEQYKELVARKVELEKQEVSDYTKGKF